MKKVLATAILCLILSPLFAADFGFDLSNNSNLTNENTLQLTQKNRLEAWFASIGDTYSLRIAGFYEFAGDFYAKGSAVLPYRFDLGNSFLYLLFPKEFGPGIAGSLSLGRFEMSDMAGRIISGLSDGADFSLKSGGFELGVLAGYTGLLNKKDANIVVSADDFNESQNAIYLFAPTRIFAGVTSKFLEIFERHDLSLELHTQFDLRPTNPIHTQYVEIGMDGRPERWFKWRAYVIFEGWENPTFNVSMALGVRAQFSVPEAAGLIVIANIDWASGSAGSLRAFAPLKQTPVAYVYRASFTDIITANLSASISPLDGITTGLSAYGLFRASSSPPSDPAFPVSATSSLLGLEGLLNVDFTISSDFSVNIKGGAFIPNTWADGYPVGTPAQLLASLELNLNI